MRRGRLALHFCPTLFIAGQTQTAVHLPAGGEPRLRLQGVVERDRVAEELRDVGAGAELPDQAGGMEGGAGGQLVALDEDRVGPAPLAAMVGRGTADDAAADDHRPRRGRELKTGRAACRDGECQYV